MAEEEPIEYERPADAPEKMNVREAAQLLASLRAKRAGEAPEAAPEEPKESEPAAEAAVEDAAPAEEAEAPGETQESEAETPIDAPRSWKAEEKERFKALPRETQEYLAERERDRDRELNRSQQEAAEKLKGLTAKELAVEQARQQYESALPQLLQTMQATQMGEFADVRTIADVEKMAAEDWPRYLKWDVAQKKIAAVQQEMLSAQQRQQTEKQQKFAEFAQKEDTAFSQAVPEAGNPEQYEKLQKGAIKLLHDLGFSDNELGEGWSGQREFNIRDHRLQLLIRDAYLYREGQRLKQTNAKAVADKKKPIPPVQRPGTAKPAGQAQVNRIKSLEEQLTTARGNASLRIATELLQARRELQR